MAKDSGPDTGAVKDEGHDDLTKAERAELARMHARLELEHQRSEDERRERLNETELDNYARTHGEPVRAQDDEKAEG